MLAEPEKELQEPEIILPEKEIKIETPKVTKKASESYFKNNQKELVFYQYLENFTRQYTLLYPGRKELLLLTKNEYQCRKFISAFIKPCLLKELLDYRSCGSFIADYVQYVPLDPAHQLPTQVQSPTLTLSKQAGNCFDISILLCSLFIGCGYDAYVVSGYALKSITLMDQSQLYNPDLKNLVPFQKKEQVKSEVAQTKYKVKKPKQLNSAFLMKQQEKLKVMQAAAEARSKQQAPVEQVEEDELKGLRIHSWVLILPGKHQISEPFFIEPSTGKVYDCEADEYLGVESVFNNVNYWVNMQICYDGLKGISFDLGDTSKWEFVILDNTQPGIKNEEGSDDDEEEEKWNEVIEVPPSWVDSISLTQEQFESKCPNGGKLLYFKNASSHIFAEYVRTDGLVQHVKFNNKDLDYPNLELYIFANRKDKLSHRVVEKNVVHEFFNPGRQHGLMEHVMVDGKTQVMEFYGTARPDGLVKRTEELRKIIYYFSDRDDFLTYRSVTFETTTLETVRGAIIKMTEKFGRNNAVPASSDIAKKTYLLKDEKIRIQYHLDEGRIISSVREFRKPQQDQKTNLELTQNFIPDVYQPQPKQQHLYMQFMTLVNHEANCMAIVKAYDREVADMIQLRKAEEADVQLTISIYDTLRNITTLPTSSATADEPFEVAKGDEKQPTTQEIDYLSPFLIGYVHKIKQENPNNLAHDEMLAVKDACLKSVRDRLIEKATIIQSRLDTITQTYQQRQIEYSRNADTITQAETEEYVQFCNDALFKIHILEKRLAKHKENATERYVEMDTKLRSDPRLSGAF